MTKKWFEVIMNGPKLRIVEHDEHRPYSLRNAVLILDGKVYASNNVTSYLLHSDCFFGAHVKIGRRKMYQVTSKHLEEARESNAYPRRSDRERDVQNRNYDAIDWLDEQLGW